MSITHNSPPSERGIIVMRSIGYGGSGAIMVLEALRVVRQALSSWFVS